MGRDCGLWAAIVAASAPLSSFGEGHCPRKAIYKREEDGIVVIDQDRCQGYRYCIKTCPYKKIYFNEVTGKSEKCIFCYPRLEKGEVNACAAQCPGRLRFVGILDDPESPVHKLVHLYRVALPLFPEKGTGPNVFYVPPFNPPKRGNYGQSILKDPRLPLDYLVYLFGEEVKDVIARLEAELKQAQEGGRSDVLQLLIGRDAETRYRVRPQLVQFKGQETTMQIPRWILALTVAVTACLPGVAQTAANPVAGTRLPLASVSASEDAILGGGNARWSQAAAKRIALNRTPPLFDTDEPAAPEISTADVRLLRAGGKLYVQLSWDDATRDAANLPTVPGTPPEQRFRKVPTEADDRFFDAAAVMVPANLGSPINPSLQMVTPDTPYVSTTGTRRGARC